MHVTCPVRVLAQHAEANPQETQHSCPHSTQSRRWARIASSPQMGQGRGVLRSARSSQMGHTSLRTVIMQASHAYCWQQGYLSPGHFFMGSLHTRHSVSSGTDISQTEKNDNLCRDRSRVAGSSARVSGRTVQPLRSARSDRFPCRPRIPETCATMRKLSVSHMPRSRWRIP